MNVHGSLPSPAAGESAGAVARRGLARLARVLSIYGLLLGGAAVFALPFVWMVGTSFKVDREMFGDRVTFLPLRPVPARQSPYLDEHYFAAPASPRYAAAGPVIEEATQRLLEQEPGRWANRGRAASILAPGLFDRLQELLPAASWERTAAEQQALWREKISSNLVAETLHKIERRLSLGPVRVRSLDLQEVDVVGSNSLAAFWTVESRVPARLRDDRDAQGNRADLEYDFGATAGGVIRLSADLPLPFPAERLFRIQFFFRPDDSWHRLEFYVEKGGRLYRGLRPEYLGNFQWSMVTLQDYGPDDRSAKIRFWIPLRPAGAAAAPGALDRVRLIVMLKQSTAWGAWWAKCQRNYTGALTYIPFWRYTATSALLVLLNIVGTILSCSLVAYSFARLQWPGRTIGFGMMMATMMIPPQVTMIPYFLIVKYLGWYNTLSPLWVISFCGNAFNIFLLRQFMKGIPRDLEDAARIDGCNSLQVYWHVIMPLIKPTLACIAIFTFMGVWNDFMGPLIYLSDQRLYPLSLGLYAFNVQTGGSFGMMMAGSLLMTLPVVVVFFFAQKYFIQGVTLTGMKA